jgi:peptidoglycan/LPS O-acetylase OafA/YrhL
MSPAERRAFRRDRLARLYPAYLLAFLLAAPFAAARGWGEGPLAAVKIAVVAALTLALLQAWVPPLARLWNPPGWSTSVIASFYLAFPHVTARLGRLSRRGLLAALAGAWALSLALPLAYLALQPDGPGAEALAREPRWLEAFKFHPLARAGELCAGVALGLLHARGLRVRRGADAIAAAALAAAAGAIASGRAPYLLLHDGLLVPLYALALLALASSAGPLARALSARPAGALGEASFALYVLQDPLWRVARRADPSAPGTASPGFVLGFCALAVVVALAVSAGLERPVRRLLRAPRTLRSGSPLRLPPG